MDADRTYRRLNAAAEELTGYTERELRGHPFPMLEAPLDQDRILDAFERARNREATRMQSHILRKDGERRDVDLRMQPIVAAGETVATTCST